MMRAQLDACRQNSEPVACLWASEDTIYGRYGYGMASVAMEIDIARERTAYHVPGEPFGETRLVALADAEPFVAPVWERVAAVTPGMFARTSAWWRARALYDAEWRRGRGGELRCAILEARGRSAGYALYRVNPAWERGVNTGTLDVVEALGDSPEATGAIWRFLLYRLDRARQGLAPADRPSAHPADGRAAQAPHELPRRPLGAPRRRRRRAGGPGVRGDRLRRDRGRGRVLSLEPGPLAGQRPRRRADERAGRP